MFKFTPKGIYCPQADIYIDPWKPVDKALITHAHADHSRWGMKHYLAHKHSVPVMRLRLGEDINVQSVEYGEPTIINGVKFSFHPAAHIIGSAQIRAEYKGEVWVASGDYKTGPDNTAEPFEPVKCNTFITESTFGLPIYQWPDEEVVFNEINEWWQTNQANGHTSILYGYSLGKAQRIINGLDVSIGKIYTHGAVENTNEVLRSAGISIQETIQVTQETDHKACIGQMIVAPPGAGNSAWSKKFKSPKEAFCSGWMALRGTRRRRNMEKGFVLSDHADWGGLNWAIEQTEAEKIYVTHGYTDTYSKWLNEQGYNAEPLVTEFGVEEDTTNNTED